MDLQQLFEKLVGRYFLYVHQWLFEATDGRITWLGGLPVLLLRTVGRKTGMERTAALVYLQDGKDLVVVASNGGSDRAPAWLGDCSRARSIATLREPAARTLRSGRSAKARSPNESALRGCSSLAALTRSQPLRWAQWCRFF
jgi:deazaflavin-dependent oxidoreductase (nitroreductase family)